MSSRLDVEARRELRLDVLRDLKTMTDAGIELDSAALGELIEEVSAAILPIDGLDEWSEAHLLALGVVEDLRERYAAKDVHIGTALLIVELDTEDASAVYYRCSDPRQWLQLGLLDAARRAVFAGDGDA